MSVSKVVAVSLSSAKGQAKENQPRIKLIADYGVEGDAHAGAPLRQVSLLALESIQKMQDLGVKVFPGAFAENITTLGIKLTKLKVGDVLQIGGQALLQISQLGKVCHEHCAIYQQVGDCVMPREGVFAVVLRGGLIQPGDHIHRQC